MEINSHSNAFPDPARCSEEGQFNQSPLKDYTSGISIRTYIATKAMQGLLANNELGSESYEETARKAVKQADSLITELNK